MLVKVQQQQPLSSLHLCDQKQHSMIKAQILNIWRTGSFLPTLAPVSCVKVAPGTCAQLPATRAGNWGVGSNCFAKSYSLPCKSSPGSCKPLIDSKVPKWLHQKDSASSVVVYVRRQIPSASQLAVFRESAPLICYLPKTFIFISKKITLKNNDLKPFQYCSGLVVGVGDNLVMFQSRNF